MQWQLLLQVVDALTQGGITITFSSKSPAQCDNICPEVLFTIFKVVQRGVLDLDNTCQAEETDGHIG